MQDDYALYRKASMQSSPSQTKGSKAPPIGCCCQRSIEEFATCSVRIQTMTATAEGRRCRHGKGKLQWARAARHSPRKVTQKVSEEHQTAPSGTQCLSPPIKEYVISESPRFGVPKKTQKVTQSGPRELQNEPPDTKWGHVLDFAGTTKSDLQKRVKYVGPRAHTGTQKRAQGHPTGSPKSPKGTQEHPRAPIVVVDASIRECMTCRGENSTVQTHR